MNIVFSHLHRLHQATIDFVGPRHKASDLAKVKDAAAHDREPSAVVGLGKDVLLINGSKLDTRSKDGLHAGDCVWIPGVGAGHVLMVDTGKGEVSPTVAKLLAGAARAIAAKKPDVAGNDYQQAINLGQDTREELAIAAHAAKYKVNDSRDNAYIRAVDLAPDAPATLEVAEHAATHGAKSMANLAYGQAIERTSSKAILLAIAKSADAHGYPAQAKAARDKASGLR